MKINFDCPTNQLQVMHQLALVPGENDIPDEIAQELIAGSEALVRNVANAKKNNVARATGRPVSPITDAEIEEARESLKGKGLFTALNAETMPTPAPLSPKKGGKK